MPRATPYTQLGLVRVPCVRCGANSRQQWRIQALENNWYGVCSDCDVELNALVLQFFRISDWRNKAADYREEVFRLGRS